MTRTRRHLKFQTLSDALADVRSLADLEYEQLGNWNLTKALDHLNKAMLASMEGEVKVLTPFFLRPFVKWYVFAKMKRRDVVRLSVPAPEAVVPDENGQLSELLSDFESLCERVEDSGTTFVAMHPYLGGFSAEEWRTMHRWHCGHHLGFLVPTAD